jgi:hypothetical protein
MRKLASFLAAASAVCLCGTWSLAAGGETAGRWYKGNTHCHSLWSDGNDFPEMIVDWYHQRGYDFLGLSDHNILADHEVWMAVEAVVKRAGGDDVLTKYSKRFGKEWVTTRDVNGTEQVRLRRLDEYRPKFEKPGRFLLIRAEEITDGFEKKPIHINAVNLQTLIPPPHGDSVRNTMRNILQAVGKQEKETGEPIIAHLNHPNFGWGITAEDLAHVIEEHFFEVYNGHPAVRHLGDARHARVERLWDIANTIRISELNAPPLYGVATDDSHTYHGRRNVSPGRGWIMVRAAELKPAVLIEAMRKGDFYASSGVTLRDVRFDPEQGVLEIDIEPDGDAEFTTEFIGTRAGFDPKSEPVLDDEGKPMEVTRRYSADVGQILDRQTGTHVRYKLSGDELYVRATITSTKPADNPSFKGQAKQAWTQPVGWKRNLPQQAAGGKSEDARR